MLHRSSSRMILDKIEQTFSFLEEWDETGPIT